VTRGNEKRRGLQRNRAFGPETRDTATKNKGGKKRKTQNRNDRREKGRQSARRLADGKRTEHSRNLLEGKGAWLVDDLQNVGLTGKGKEGTILECRPQSEGHRVVLRARTITKEGGDEKSRAVVHESNRKYRYRGESAAFGIIGGGCWQDSNWGGDLSGHNKERKTPKYMVLGTGCTMTAGK